MPAMNGRNEVCRRSAEQLPNSTEARSLPIRWGKSWSQPVSDLKFVTSGLNAPQD
jgi:hypothetical protein